MKSDRAGTHDRNDHGLVKVSLVSLRGQTLARDPQRPSPGPLLNEYRVIDQLETLWASCATRSGDNCEDIFTK